MNEYSDITKRFLLATKRAEINALQQLASNCQVVTSVSELIHQLQKERGISNIFLSSSNARFSEQRDKQIEDSLHTEDLLRSQLKAKYLNTDDMLGNMRLLNVITLALQGMDHICVLRHKIKMQKLTALESTQAYSRLITGLLSVVFEAADVAGDPVITKLLVALFNFIQAKECAGQERAWGAVGFAKSTFDPALCERLEQLQQAQSKHFNTFIEFASDNELESWKVLQSDASTAPLDQMRSMIQQLADGAAISSEISEVWYELSTKRIDQMRAIEKHLASRLLDVAKQRLAEVNDELFEHKKRLKKVDKLPVSEESALSLFFDAPVEHSSHEAESKLRSVAANRSFYDLLRDQSEHIKQMSSELDEAKQTIVDQKKIDRAKLLLMQQLSYSEAQSHRALQKQAMDQKISLADMADLVIKTGKGK
ncbi:MAG: nitrate- and nitrite sensing domain-containing protein [Paraglaciecola sp.]|nr:nitrate- and nitrite sensing domain-containing protein [Paraglaciecola sp.]